MNQLQKKVEIGTFIPLCEPVIRGNEWAYVKECLDTAWISSVGSYVDRFEKKLATYVGSSYAVATVNGTSALHISLLLAGVKTEDEVITSALSFIAPANTIRYVGGWPIFIDAEPKFYQMDVEKLADFLNKGCSWENGALRNKKTGRRIGALLPVHILGHSLDMDPILELASRYDLPVIEDSTEALGTLYKNRHVGNLGSIGTFSFNGNKIISTGGGGMLVTNNAEWAKKAKYLTTQAKDDAVEFIHGEVGYNYRLTNVLAAIGFSQLEKLDEYIAAKRRIAQHYQKALKEIPGLIPMPEVPWSRSTFWMYTILVDEARYGLSSRDLMKKLSEKKIQARPLWQPLHQSPAFKNLIPAECPVAERLNMQALSLPCSVNLTDVDLERVLGVLKGD